MDGFRLCHDLSSPVAWGPHFVGQPALASSARGDTGPTILAKSRHSAVGDRWLGLSDLPRLHTVASAFSRAFCGEGDTCDSRSDASYGGIPVYCSFLKHQHRAQLLPQFQMIGPFDRLHPSSTVCISGRTTATIVIFSLASLHCGISGPVSSVLDSTKYQEAGVNFPSFPLASGSTHNYRSTCPLCPWLASDHRNRTLSDKNRRLFLHIVAIVKFAILLLNTRADGSF